MKLSEIRQILSEHDLRLTKSLGQNFLHDQNQLARIVAAAELEAVDPVLEIGPGLGPLTDALLARAARVLAIEKDHRLFEILQKKYPNAANLQLIHGDGLDYVKEHREWKGWKLVANLPYAVGSPILVELAQAHHAPERLVATLQIEVAQRIHAEVGSKQYGILTLLLQVRYETNGWFKIPASCFFPAPKVDSACVTLERWPVDLLEPQLHGLFARIVKRGFSQRRKTMSKLLKQDWPEDLLMEALKQADIPLQARAETAELGQFVRLTKILGLSLALGPEVGSYPTP